MADETQVAPVAGAQENNATQENKGFTYYFSDPDSANAEMHHVVIPLPYELPELPWHWHTEKPDESLKDPIWDVKTNGWVENSKDGQAAILQQATQKLAELDKKSSELDQANDKFDQAMKAVQKAQTVGTQQSEMITKTLGKLMESQENSNKLMMGIQKTVMGLVKQDDKTQPTTDASNANTPTETTNDNK